MRRRLAHGIEQLAACGASEGAEGDRRIGHAEGGEADFGNGLAKRVGHDAERVHVRGLALVGRHAGRGVALDVLDRAEAFAHRELDILRGHVVLEVDEGLSRVAASIGGAATARTAAQPNSLEAGPADARTRRRRPLAIPRRGFAQRATPSAIVAS